MFKVCDRLPSGRYFSICNVLCLCSLKPFNIKGNVTINAVDSTDVPPSVMITSNYW